MYGECSGTATSTSSLERQSIYKAAANIAYLQSESVLIQKIFTHFKKTPGTHKLGVLYVVDSVTRQWVEQAKKTGQPAGNAAQDGTFAAGVNRVTELLPVLMTDIIQHAPEDQKVRILTIAWWLYFLAERLDTIYIPYRSSGGKFSLQMRIIVRASSRLTYDHVPSRKKSRSLLTSGNEEAPFPLICLFRSRKN